MLRKLKPQLWNISQLVFGANAEKLQMFRQATGIDDLALANRRILDCGCATGNLAPAFADCQYTGVDIDSALIEYASAKYRSYSNMTFLTNSEFEVKYCDARWPIVLFSATAHHLDDATLVIVLEQLRSLLEPGGKICFIEPVTTGHESQLLRFLMAMDQGHFHRTIGAYIRVFDDLGFHVSRTRPIQASGRLFPQPAGVIFDSS